MKFVNHTFTMKTSVTKDADAFVSTITLIESDVDDDIIMASATSGQSPRVRWQANFREYGVPSVKEMTWTEWFGNPPRSVRNKALNLEQIMHKMATDPTFRAEFAAKIKENPQLLSEQE